MIFGVNDLYFNKSLPLFKGGFVKIRTPTNASRPYRRAGACSCRVVGDLINGKNNNIVGQGLAPAVLFGI